MKKYVISFAVVSLFCVFISVFCGLPKDAFGKEGEKEIILYQQDFEKYDVGENNLGDIGGKPGKLIEVTDNAHYTSKRALKISIDPKLEIDPHIYLAPGFPISDACALNVSVRVKLEDIVDQSGYKTWLYPYIRVNFLDENNNTIDNSDLLYQVAKTESESSGDDNWIVINKEITPKKEAAKFSLVIYAYDGQGISGTVYIDDIKIVKKKSS